MVKNILYTLPVAILSLCNIVAGSAIVMNGDSGIILDGNGIHHDCSFCPSKNPGARFAHRPEQMTRARRGGVQQVIVLAEGERRHLVEQLLL